MNKGDWFKERIMEIHYYYAEYSFYYWAVSDDFQNLYNKELKSLFFTIRELNLSFPINQPGTIDFQRTSQ